MTSPTEQQLLQEFNNELVGGNDPHSAFAYTQHPENFSNPPFDPRRYSTNPWYAKVEQGLMYRDNLAAIATSGTLGKSSAITNAQSEAVPNSVMLRFLYNPSDFNETLTPSDTLFPNITGSTGNTDANDTSALIGQTTTTCSFNLLFDRTYEINSALDNPGSKFSHQSGVGVDIKTLKMLLGIPADGNGMALFLPVHLVLGGTNSITFYGVVTTASIVYSHFTVDMRPLRAAVSLSMTQWLDDTSGSGNGTGAAPGGDSVSPGIGPASNQNHSDTLNGILPPPKSGTAVPGITGSGSSGSGNLDGVLGPTTSTSGNVVTVSQTAWLHANPGKTPDQFAAYVILQQQQHPQTLYVVGP